jgi:hypothetical protein
MIASFIGHPGRPMAFYQTAQGGLVGVTLMVAYTPQHGILIARSGAGKSVLGQDLVSQVAGFYAVILIVDSGNSYEALTGVISPGSRPVVVQPNGTLTINYLDPGRQPLGPEHFSQVVLLLVVMAGRAHDEDRRRREEAVLHAAMQQLYSDHFADWERDHPEAALRLAALACHLADQCAAQPGLAFTEAFALWRDAGEVWPQVSEARQLSALKEPRHRELVRNLAYAFMAPAEQPTHSMLVELLRFDFGADRNTARALADALEKWRRQGPYGPLVDGPGNVDLKRGWVQFELGSIPQRDEGLRAVAMLLVLFQIWIQIFARPRHERKLIVLEEASALLTIPEAAQLLATVYEQARKMNASVITVFPAYAPLANSPIRETVMGNSRFFLIGRLDDPQEAERLGRDLPLPPSAVEAIKHLPMPTDRDRGASFLYYHRHDPLPVCGVLVNVVSPEMHYVAASHGAHVAARREHLKGDPATVLERVIAHAKTL